MTDFKLDQMIAGHEVELAIREHGRCESSLPSLVLLHGAGRTLEDWAFVSTHLQEDFHLLSVDLRNHGLAGDAPWSWPAVVADIQQLVIQTGLGAHAVIGHSLGGMIASLYAAQTSNCLAAINLDGHGIGQPEDYAGIPLDTARTRLQQMTNLSSSMAPAPDQCFSPTDIAQIESQLREDSVYAEDWTLRAFRRGLQPMANGGARLRPVHQRYVELQKALAGLRLAEVYKQTKCPLLIVQTLGSAKEREEISQLAMTAWMPWFEEMQEAYRQGLARRLRQLSQDHPLIRFEQLHCGHGATLEAPELIAGLIRDFIDAQIGFRPEQAHQDVPPNSRPASG